VQITAIYIMLFESVRNSIGIIKPSVFMSDDEPAFYKAWSSIMGPTPKQLLRTWHVLRKSFKNKIIGQKNFSFQNIKSLIIRS